MASGAVRRASDTADAGSPQSVTPEQFLAEDRAQQSGLGLGQLLRVVDEGETVHTAQPRGQRGILAQPRVAASTASRPVIRPLDTASST